MTTRSQKRVVDEKYLAHIRDEVKQIKELKSEDRLEAHRNCLSLLGVLINHTRSLVMTLSQEAMVSGLLNDLTEEQFSEVFESLVDLSLKLLKTDAELTRMIPIVPEMKQSHDSNPLVK